MFRFCSFFALFLVLTTFKVNGKRTEVISLTDETWTEMLEGQWMVKFYAPWCPACRDLEDDWNALATWQNDLNFKCGQVDVSDNPALSGRFLVTSLPTIYHVQDGEFRIYSNKLSRKEKDLVAYVDDAAWKNSEVQPWYTNPTSIHMSLVGQFFRLSLAIRDLHNRMTTEFGIPVWGSYIAFAILTIVVGLLMGLCCVCLCDCCCPPVVYTPPPKEPSRYSKIPSAAYKKDDGDDADEENKEAPVAAAADTEAEATGGDVKPKATRKRTVQKE